MKEVDTVFYPVVGPTYIRTMMLLCVMLTLIDTYPSMNYPELYLWIPTCLNVGYIINITLGHVLPGQCAEQV